MYKKLYNFLYYKKYIIKIKYLFCTEMHVHKGHHYYIYIIEVSLSGH